MTSPVREAIFGDIDIHGDGGQLAFGNQVNRDLIQNSNKFVRGQPSMYLGMKEVADRLRCYVPANNHDLIVKALEIDRAVILIGPAGCGRETTAIAAIDQLRHGISIRRFSVEDEDTEEINTKGDGYLVHATEGGLPRLGSCIEAVHTSGGYLAIIADTEIERTPAAAYLHRIPIEPPQPIQIYQRRLTVLGLTEWSYWDDALMLLEQALPAEARRLTELIEQINPRGGDIATRQAEVLHAYRGWQDELRVWFRDHPEPHERALLVAAAALAPAEKPDVYSVAASLARRLKTTINGAGLAWCPVTGLRDLLQADDEDGRIAFRRHGFAISALRHALVDFPLACSDLLAWLAALPTDKAVPDKLRNSLAGTFADLAAEHGPAELITETVRNWGTDGLADLAFTALFRTCLHPRVGAPVRQALYGWSRTAQTPQTLKLVIARVCEPLGQTYPAIALTRLKHLATHGNRQVLGEVILAAQELVASGQRAEVLAAALDWCAETNRERLSPPARRRRRHAGARLFLELARPVIESGLPEVLDGDRAVDPMRYEPGWRTALEVLTISAAEDLAVEDVVHRWLDAALRLPHVRDRIMMVFIMAARPSCLRGNARYGVEHAMRDRTAAEIMIGMVRRWATLDRADPVRKMIKEDIVVALTPPWWLRLLKKILYGYRRELIKAR